MELSGFSLLQRKPVLYPKLAYTLRTLTTKSSAVTRYVVPILTENSLYISVSKREQCPFLIFEEPSPTFGKKGERKGGRYTKKGEDDEKITGVQTYPSHNPF